MEDLKSILEGLLKTTPKYSENVLRSKIFDAWPRVVGERMARHCWPIRLLDDGILLIGSDNSAWLHSLRFVEAQILEKFAKELGAKDASAIKGLRAKLETRRPS